MLKKYLPEPVSKIANPFSNFSNLILALFVIGLLLSVMAFHLVAGK
jgi:hypothetical protein